MRTEDFFVLEYRCLGWLRPSVYRQPFITACSQDGNVIPLVCYDDITADGRKYTVAVRVGQQSLSSLSLTLYTGHRPETEFTVCSMYFCTEAELPCYCAGDLTAEAGNYTAIDLRSRCNRHFSPDANDIRLGGGRFFDRENITLHSIPFEISIHGNNCIAPPPPPAENEDIIENFGVKARRRVCRPVSRDSETAIELHKNVTELFFLLSIEGKRYQRCGFATGGTILGQSGSEVTLPLFVDDIEGFAVELVYADGKNDLCLPLNITTGKHGITDDISLYAIPATGDEIEKVIFHNRSLDSDFSLIALTVNETSDRLFPEMLIPALPEKLPHNADTGHSIVHEADRLILKNGAITMAFDLSRGLYLDAFENQFTPEFHAAPGSLLRIRQETGIFSDFQTVSCNADSESASILLRGYGLSFEVTATFDGLHNILWQLKAKNNAAHTFSGGILFPCISGIEYRNKEDGWYFMPKYQNINSNETVYVYEESAPSFPMQFFDVYSPAQQGGLAVVTKERDLVVRKYALEKKDTISFFIEYPEMYCSLEFDAEFSASPTLLTAHEGDWHKAFELYRNWLNTWYRPYHCQDKKWYRQCFWLLAEITDFFETEEHVRFPIWYDKETDKFNYLPILEEQKEISGAYPDILHMWAWSNRFLPNGQFTQKWGNYAESEYADYGGLENFRNALHEFMEKTGVKSSVYLHPTLLTNIYPQFEKYKHLTVKKADGGTINIGGHSFRMCHANEDWREYALSIYPRICKELQVPILYVDEFSLRVENRCYAKDHGHEVPSNLLKTDRDFITRLKDSVPEDVILYGEYAAVDINARYIDCNISYSIIDTVVDMIETAWHGCDGDDRMSRVITDLYRFAFPGIVQLVLPMAMRNLSWHPQKFIFFNGEAIYDSMWDLEESAGHTFTCHAYRLKKQYADCFSSDTPETMVETLTPAICANRFPGDGRVVYTVYNRAYSTYRGPVLRIPHTEGTVYYDAWNDEPLVVDIRDGWAELHLTVHAQSIGCIAISTV
ncbi:MAG: hypothetical protein IJ412_12255 [Oscillospiraceae bacterium]|nr:hypothetical protein [Oscillospiraceae bacterium]